MRLQGIQYRVSIVFAQVHLDRKCTSEVILFGIHFYRVTPFTEFTPLNLIQLALCTQIILHRMRRSASAYYRDLPVPEMKVPVAIHNTQLAVEYHVLG